MEASAQQSYSVRVENRRQRFTLLGCDPNSCCGLTGHNAHCTKPSLLVCDSHMSQLLLLDLQRLRLLQAVLQQRRANFPAVRWELHSWIKQGVSCYPGGSKALRAHYDGLGLRSIKNLQSTLDLLLSNPEWLPFADGHPQLPANNLDLTYLLGTVPMMAPLLLDVPQQPTTQCPRPSLPILPLDRIQEVGQAVGQAAGQRAGQAAGQRVGQANGYGPQPPVSPVPFTSWQPAPAAPQPPAQEGTASALLQSLLAARPYIRSEHRGASFTITDDDWGQGRLRITVPLTLTIPLEDWAPTLAGAAPPAPPTHSTPVAERFARPSFGGPSFAGALVPSPPLGLLSPGGLLPTADLLSPRGLPALSPTLLLSPSDSLARLFAASAPGNASPFCSPRGLQAAEDMRIKSCKWDTELPGALTLELELELLVPGAQLLPQGRPRGVQCTPQSKRAREAF